MHKLSRVEAERVAAVLDETIAKLRLVRCIPSRSVGVALDDLSRSGAADIASSVSTVWGLEQERSSWLVQQKHEDEVRALVRFMQRDSTSTKVLASYLAAGRSAKSQASVAALDVLIGQLQTLRATSLSKLSTTVEDELATHDRIRELRTAEATLSEDRRVLTRRLVEARALRERDVAELDAKIAKLKKQKNEMTQIVDTTFSSLDKTTRDARARMEEEHQKTAKALAESEAKHATKLSETRGELNAKASVDMKKKNQSVNHRQQAVARFDSDVTKKYDELQALKGEYEREKERFELLQVHFDKIDEEAGRALHEEQMLVDEQLLRAYADKLINECVTGLQKVRRAKIGRSDAAKKAKKGGKKKK